MFVGLGSFGSCSGSFGSCEAVGGRRGRRRAGRRGPAERPAQPGAAGCPKGAWPSNTAGAPSRVRARSVPPDSVQAPFGPPAPRTALKDRTVGGAESRTPPTLGARPGRADMSCPRE